MQMIKMLGLTSFRMQKKTRTLVHLQHHLQTGLRREQCTLTRAPLAGALEREAARIIPRTGARHVDRKQALGRVEVILRMRAPHLAAARHAAGANLASQLGALGLAALALERLHLETGRTGPRAVTTAQH
jgi:hypothetical protein